MLEVFGTMDGRWEVWKTGITEFGWVYLDETKKDTWVTSGALVREWMYAIYVIDERRVIR